MRFLELVSFIIHVCICFVLFVVVFDIYSTAKSQALNEKADTASLSWRFCVSFCCVMEALCGTRNAAAEKIIYNNNNISSSSSSFEGQSGGADDEICDDVALSSTPWNTPSSLSKRPNKNNNNFSSSGSSSVTSARSLSSFLDASSSSAATAHRLAPSTVLSTMQHSPASSGPAADADAFLAEIWAGLKASFAPRSGTSASGVESTMSLVLARLFARLSAVFAERVQSELQSHELERLDGNMIVKVQRL